MAQQVKDLALSLLWLRLLLWHGFDPRPRVSCIPWAQPKKKKKKGNRNVILVVGVVALEIPVLFLLSTARKIFRGGELGPTFNLTSREVRCWPYYKLWLENTLSPHLQQK